VGVRVSGSNPRKGACTNNLPCIVREVVSRHVGSGPKKTHHLYKVVCEFGMVSSTFKIDKLVPLSLNNFPEMVALKQVYGELSATERGRLEKLTLTNAYEKYIAKSKQRTVDQSRQRSVATRAAATAADTAIAIGQADKHAAPSPAATSYQPSYQPARSGPVT